MMRLNVVRRVVVRCDVVSGVDFFFHTLTSHLVLSQHTHRTIVFGSNCLLLGAKRDVCHGVDISALSLRNNLGILMLAHRPVGLHANTYILSTLWRFNALFPPKKVDEDQGDW